jgi:hypothetical protein
VISKKGAEGRLASETDQQQVASDDGRQNEGQMHHRIEQGFTPERSSRQQHGNDDAERERSHGRHRGDAQRQRDRGPVLGRKVEHGVVDTAYDTGLIR